MKGWVIAVLALAASGCGQNNSDPEQAPQEAQKGAFEAYTDSQAEALKKAKGVEDTLNQAEAERRKRLEQMQ